MNQSIKNAIEKSQGQNQVVRVTVNCETITEALTGIDGETGFEHKSDGSYDVWGWKEKEDGKEPDWRINVALSKMTLGADAPVIIKDGEVKRPS